MSNKATDASEQPLSSEEMTNLDRFRTQGTLSQQEAVEYHRLLNKTGE